jgi:regulatory protein
MSNDCRDTALRFLAHRSRTVSEVRGRLLSRGFSAQETEAALEYLREFRYLDDAEYCREYIRYGRSKGRGPHRLQSGLEEKGVDAALARKILEENFDRQAEREAALREAKKALLRARPLGSPSTATGMTRLDPKTIARIARRLAALGYCAEVVYEVVGELRRLR